MIPFITCEISLCQYVCELDLGVQIDSLKQPIKSNSVGPGDVSHCGTPDCELQHGPNFGVPSFGSDDFSSSGKMYSRHATDSVNCENSSVSFVMKYFPTSTVVKNPASVQIFINLSGCDSLSTRSCYFCNSFLAQNHRSNVWVFSSTSFSAQTVGQIVLPKQVALF